MALTKKLKIESNARHMTQFVYFIGKIDVLAESVKASMQTANTAILACSSLKEFVRLYEPQYPGCVVHDLENLQCGEEVQQFLHHAKVFLPLIILSSRNSISDAVRSVKCGIYDYLGRPYSNEDLADSLLGAIQSDCNRLVLARTNNIWRSRFDSLSPREHQILKLVNSRKTIGVIAKELNIGEKTVETHRSRIMAKMNAQSIPDLLRMLDGINPENIEKQI